VVSEAADPARTISIEEVARASGLTHASRRSTQDAPFEPDFRFLQHRYGALGASALADIEASGAEPFDALLFAGGTGSDHGRLRAAYFGERQPSGTGSTQEDVGVAGPLVAILDAAQTLPGQNVGLLAHGDGQLVALRLRLPAGAGDGFGWSPPPAEAPAPASRSELGPELSLPVDSPFFVRTWGESLRLEAGRCGSCGHVAYPASSRPICPGCGSRSAWEVQPLARTGTVLTHIDNRFLPDGFPSKVVYLLGELSDGYRHWAPMPPEYKGGDVAIDDAVELRLRRFTVREGVPVYGMKFVPGGGS
jgi:uncharacterized OB-fold protein